MRTLDLEDVPQLHSGDSVVGAFLALRHKIESDGSTIAGVTMYKLVKALFFSTWKEILWTTLLVLLYTIHSYVGPYLIDAFVHCLNGQGAFKN